MQPKMTTVGYVASVLMTLMVSLIGKLNIQNKIMEQEVSEKSPIVQASRLVLA